MRNGNGLNMNLMIIINQFQDTKVKCLVFQIVLFLSEEETIKIKENKTLRLRYTTLWIKNGMNLNQLIYTDLFAGLDENFYFFMEDLNMHSQVYRLINCIWLI